MGLAATEEEKALIMRFEFATVGRIIFGPGVIDELGEIVSGWGQRVLLVTGRHPARSQRALSLLAGMGLDVELFRVSREPTVDMIADGVERARAHRSEMVVGCGGGSVLDAGKAIAALLTNGGVPLDYLEVVGKGKPILNPSAPYVAIPTTAGTGAEVTRNAVLAVPEQRVKVSMRSQWLLPRVALVDPGLTHSMPPGVTASTGLDALTQLIEPYVSRLANPLTDAVCREGLVRAGRSLRRAYTNGSDAQAREDMALASLCGGLALANAKLGAVHGFAGVLGGMYEIPHGIICGRLLPSVVTVNVRALQSRVPDHRALQRYREIGMWLTGRAEAQIEDAVQWILDTCDLFQIPGLASYGVARSDFPTIVAKARRSSSMKGNPIQLTEQELLQILEQAL